MASCSPQVAPQQYMKAVHSVLSPQDPLEKLPKAFVSSIIEMRSIDVEPLLPQSDTNSCYHFRRRDVEKVLLEALTLAGSDQLVASLLPELVKRYIFYISPASSFFFWCS